MKLRYIILILLVVPSVLGVKAQQTNKQFVNKVQSQRIAFFTQRMEITPAEAQKFWPLYNEYTQKKNALSDEKNKLTKAYKANSATMTESEVDATIQKYVSLAKQETELLEDYNKKFRSVLPAQKVMKLYLAEFEFKEWLLKQIREKG
ncbi:MAG TPA: hypothetical protein VHO72_17920 [Bacteroidales bacterium]|nr:hypothetical protein [Bacteroidales bacterium]